MHRSAGGRSQIEAGKETALHVKEALQRANRGRPLPADQRRKIGEAHKRLGTRPPKAGGAGMPEEDALLMKFTAKVIAGKTGRTLKAIYDRRHDLGLPDGRRQ